MSEPISVPHAVPLRVSLAEAARRSGAMIKRGNSAHLDAGAAPTFADLTECLFFSPGDGRIWLDDQRMLLLHSAAFGTLRRELIASFGAERARGVLTRAGYASGARDAALVRERWPDADGASLLAAGTRLHALEGVVKVEPVHFAFDAQTGRYDGEFLWHHSAEADEHIAAYGVGSEPVCWMELGYAIGYVTGLTGTLVIFREVECRAMGSATCRVVGRDAARWDDVADDLRYLEAPLAPVAVETGMLVGQATSVARQRLRGGASVATDSCAAADVSSGSSAALTGGKQRAKTTTSATISSDGDSDLIGIAAAFVAARDALVRVAPTDAAVLLTGESGVGKERFAAALHRRSRRAPGPFVAVNCAALPDTLIEAELFGVERGAFTGALVSRAGRFERASGGTLFLDEIASLPFAAQGKLLRALQEREIERVGGMRTQTVDVRVIAASNVDLRDEVKRGRFREDLFFRLNVFPIVIPPLRERRDDIALLIERFLAQFCREYGRSTPGLTSRARRALLNYTFPGNIRELRNMVERGVIAIDDGAPIDLPHLFRHEPLPADQSYSVDGGMLRVEGPLHERGAPVSADSRVADAGATAGAPALAAVTAPSVAQGPISIDAIEAGLLSDALARANGNVSAAARLVGLSRAQFAYRLEKHRRGR